MASIINASSSGSGGIVQTADASGVLQLQSNGTAAVTIDTSQRVGIGTTSPTSPLQVNTAGVNTTVQINSTDANGGYGAVLALNNTGTGGRQYAIYSTSNADGDVGGGKFKFYDVTAGATRMFIDSSGNAYFQYGGASQNGAPSGINLTGPASTQLQFYMLKSTQVEAHFGFKSSTDTNLYVGTGGGMSGIGIYGLYQANTSNTWTAVSDLRFKTELEPVSNALEKVANVRTVTGRYTHDEENGVTRRRPFLIAQDFVDALPEAVDQQDPDKLGLSYSDTVVLAFAAIKELKAINDQQAETINALTARVVALESK